MTKDVHRLSKLFKIQFRVGMKNNVINVVQIYYLIYYEDVSRILGFVAQCRAPIPFRSPMACALLFMRHIESGAGLAGLGDI